MSSEPLALGPFRVRVDAARAAAYRRETGAPPAADDAAPLAYPAVWLSSPQIHAEIARVCGERDSVPVHESQSFDYVAPLRAGEDYALSVTLRQEETPPRLIIAATVATLSGEARASIEAMLRLVPRSALKMGAA